MTNTMLKQYHDALVSAISKQRWREKQKILAIVQQTYIAVLEDQLLPGKLSDPAASSLLTPEETSVLNQRTGEDENSSSILCIECEKPNFHLNAECFNCGANLSAQKQRWTEVT